MEDRLTEAMNLVTATVAAYGLDVLGAIAMLVVGLVAAGWAQRATDRALTRFPRFDRTLRGFFASIARYLVIIITVLAVLGQFGVQTASLIAVLATAGLAVGLALQGTLSNVAAGVMLLIFRPFRVGDYIDAGGQAGTVDSLSLFVTELSTPDNVRIIVPNGQIWGAAIKNFSTNPKRRLDLTIGIAYKDDINKATAAIRSVIEAELRADADPPPPWLRLRTWPTAPSTSSFASGAMPAISSP